MIPPILPRLRSRLSGILAAAVYGLDADREAARGLAEVCCRQQREIGEARAQCMRWRMQAAEMHEALTEARKIAGEAEARADQNQQWAGEWREQRDVEKRRADRLQQRINDIEAAPDAS